MKNVRIIPGFWFLLPMLALLFACVGNEKAGTQIKTRVKPLDCQTPQTVTGGQILGARIRSGCAYKGIPYAAPPVGGLRFKNPQAVRPWSGVRKADTLLAECLQLGKQPLSTGNFAEDCLFINVWRPDTAVRGKKLPVMLWIYGGGFVNGGSAWTIYNGADLITHDVVLVTFNYRLGPVGWLASEALRADAEDGSVGNYGLQDQIEALRWVNKNIATFGGDPGNVTIFGESAGGFSVCALMAAPGARGLFHKAIMESGICVSGEIPDQYAGHTTWIAGHACPLTGTDAVSCLRDLSEENLMQEPGYSMGDGYFPLVDGVSLTEQPIVAIEAGRAAPVPFLAGFNAEELKAMALLPQFYALRDMPFAEFWRRLTEVFDAAEIAALKTMYPQELYSDPVELWADALNDQVFGCSAWEAVKGQSSYASSYMYRFSFGDNLISAYTGSFHGSEVPFVFGNLGLFSLLYNGLDAQKRMLALSEKIQKYWTGFARTGVPQAGKKAQWPTFAPEGNLILLQPDESLAAGRWNQRCQFWSPRLPREINARLHYLTRAPRAVDADIPGF